MGKPATIISILVSLSFCLLWLAGCSWGQTTDPFGAGSWTPPTIPTSGTPSSALGVLNCTAGLSIIGGVIGMVLGSRAAGMRAITIGVILVTLSYVIAAYAHMVLIPTGIVLSIISAIWGYKTIISAWRTRS